MVLESSASLAASLRIVLGVVAGVVATFGMDAAMTRLPEGETPPTVAAGVLTRTDPDEAPERLAAAAHYLAGGATGPLYVTLLFLAEGVAGGASPVVYAATAAVLFLLMVGFFVVVVLPRPGLPKQRVSRISRDWAVSALAYLLVLVPVVWAGSSALGRLA